MSNEKKNRVDNDKLNLRIFEVAKLMLKGYSKRAFLIQKISSDYDWNVVDRQIDNYIKEAKVLIANSYSEDELKVEKDIAVSRLEAIYTQNMQIQDLREARNAVMDRCKLLGLLTEKQQIDHTTKGDKINITTTPERAEKLKEFLSEND